MRSRWVIGLAIVALVLMLAPASHAARIHVSQSYAQGLTEVGSGTFEFQVSSPLYIELALKWGGYQGFVQNLNGDGNSEVIFEDSATYVVATDFANDNMGLAVGGYTSGLFLDGYAAGGAGGLYVHAAPGEMPTIDFSNTTHPWGIDPFLQFFNTNPSQEFLFEGLRLVDNDSNNGWGSAAFVFNSTATLLGVKDCVFENNASIFKFGGGLATSAFVLPASAPFIDHCAFRMTGIPATNNALFIKGDLPDTSNIVRWSQCTFIATNPAASWGSGWGNFGHSFDDCIFSNWTHTSWYGGVSAYTYNLDWPIMSTFKPDTIGNISSDPIFLDTNATDFWLISDTSPAVGAGQGGNMGFDQAAGGPEPPFPGTPVVGLLGLTLLAGASALAGLRTIRRKK